MSFTLEMEAEMLIKTRALNIYSDISFFFKSLI